MWPLPDVVTVGPHELWGGAGLRSPLELRLDAAAGRPATVVVDGAAKDWQDFEDRLRGDGPREVRATLRRAPAVTIAVLRGPVGRRADSRLADVLAHIDLLARIGPCDETVNVAGDEEEVAGRVAAWIEGIAAAPAASTVGAMLVRGDATRAAPEALLHESQAYSMLLAGPAFARWLDGRRPGRPVAEEAPVRATTTPSFDDVQLNRPARHNAFSSDMRDRLTEILGALMYQRSRPILLTGAGQSFCSGGDLDEFGTTPDPVAAHWIRVGRSPALLLDALSARTVVGLQGFCAGAGIELAAFAGTVIAAEDTTVWLPEAAMGLIPGAGGTVSLPRRIGTHRFVEMLVTGRRVGARLACSWGLVDEVVPRQRLRGRLEEHAARLASEGA